MAAFQPASLGADVAFLSDSDTTSPLEVYFACTGLPNLDRRSNSDPFVVVYLNTDGPAHEPGEQIYTSEAVRNSNDPAFTTPLHLTYVFEALQRLTVRVYDQDHKAPLEDLGKHDVIGQAQFTVGELMGVDGGTPGALRRDLLSSARKRGTLQVFAEEKVVCNEVLEIQFAAKKLANKDGIFGRSDPYIVVHRLREDGSWMPVWKSEVVMNNLSPIWRRARLPLTQLCGGDKDRPLRFEVWDYDSNNEHDYMGSFQASLSRLLQDDASGTFSIVEEKKRAKSSRYKNSGELRVLEHQLLVVPNFLDYLKGGLELSMIVAIDYTASNGPVDDPRSLHFHDTSGMPNAYEAAIGAVGRVLEPYDADRRFPVYGFGGRVNGQVSHCFRLAPPDGGEARGVAGVLDIYKGSIHAVALSGPTLFAALIREAANAAQADMQAGAHKYTVLTIITDGQINDMQNSIDALVDASIYPLSVIIVGVGDADFSGMDALDGDDGALRSRSGHPAPRDIVQFVPVSRFGTSTGGYTAIQRELLAELPGQVVKFYGHLATPPNPGASREEMAAQAGVALPPKRASLGPPGPSAPPPDYSAATRASRA